MARKRLPPYLRLSVDKTAMDRYYKGAVTRFFGAGSDALLEVVKLIRKRMNKAGSKPYRPTPWVTDRQRNAFFRSNGFGGGIPHHRPRSGGYRRGWVIQEIGATRAKDRIVLTNHYRGAVHIGGDLRGYQSPIHRGRWANLAQVLKEEMAKLPKRIRESVKSSWKRTRSG